jgi:lambda repressor-like predicted transcriptional regulator
MLKKLRAGTAEADRCLAAVRGVLPPELAQQVWGASLRGATVTAFVQTAAWGTRLRYVTPKLTVSVAAALGVPVEEIKVKVRVDPRRGQ